MAIVIDSPVMQKKAKSVLFAMERSDFNFFLTGSRFFGTHTDKSDTDYFVQEDNRIMGFLEELGFRMLGYGEQHYHDCECVCVMRNEYEKIDVQIVRNAVKKNEIQKILATGIIVPVGSLNTHTWDVAYLMYNSLRGI